MTFPTIHQSYVDSNILLIELDHPPANSLSKAMKNQFLEMLARVEQEAFLRAIIITGRGDKFCTGDDLKEATHHVFNEDHDVIIKNLQRFSEIIDRFEALPIPIIGAINGWCVGGGLELALCCDIRIAVPNAKFITAGVNVGLTASAYRLPRLIGAGRAKFMLLTGTSIYAEQALNYGLITEIVEAEALLPNAIEIARNIASKAPLAVKATKRIANLAFDLSEKEGYLFQQKELEILASSKDYKEALTAFSEKRSPDFKGE
jgi:enoyl-CoA hydratase